MYTHKLKNSMGTPVKPFIHVMRSFIIYITIIWLTVFVCDRIYAVYEEYCTQHSKRTQEKWLLNNCQDPFFYANLRTHSDLCTIVEFNSRRNILFYSIQSTVQKTRLCGELECIENLFEILNYVMNMSMSTLIILALVSLICPMLFVHVTRSIMLLVLGYNRSPYNAPFYPQHMYPRITSPFVVSECDEMARSF